MRRRSSNTPSAATVTSTAELPCSATPTVAVRCVRPLTTSSTFEAAPGRRRLDISGPDRASWTRRPARKLPAVGQPGNGCGFNLAYRLRRRERCTASCRFWPGPPDQDPDARRSEQTLECQSRASPVALDRPFTSVRRAALTYGRQALPAAAGVTASRAGRSSYLAPGTRRARRGGSSLVPPQWPKLSAAPGRGLTVSCGFPTAGISIGTRCL